MQVISKKSLGRKKLVDIEVDHPCHNFVLSNGLISSNSHSIAYSALTAKTIYLKYKYKTEFFLANLRMTNNKGEQQTEIASIVLEMLREGIDILPPKIGKSRIDFEIEDKKIRHGLGCIRDIKQTNESKLKKLVNHFDSKYDILFNATEAKLNVTVLSALARCGFFDDFVSSRSEFVYEIQYWNKLNKEKELLVKYNYPDRIDVALEKISKKTGANGKPLVLESRMETIRKHTIKYRQLMETNMKHETYSNWYFERHYLGYSFSSKLKNILDKKYENVLSTTEIKKCRFQKGDTFRLGCEVMDKPFIGLSKNNNRYMRLDVMDDYDKFSVMLVGDDKIKYCEDNNGRLPDKGDIIIARGSPNKERTTLFCENIGIIPNKVLTKTSQVR